MSQLVEPDEVSTTEYATRLWQEIKAGFLVYREPTYEESIARRENRAVLLRDSHVPWIVSDLGSVLQFFDDAQDILALATWNKALIIDPVLLAVAGNRNVRRVEALADAYSEVCPSGRPSKRNLLSMFSQDFKRIPKGGADLAGWLGTLREGSMWALLAGQVSKTLTGVGIVLGGIVGAAMEAYFRSPAGILFNAQRGLNKNHQLTRARALMNVERGWGAMPFLTQDDRTTGFVGTWFATQGLVTPPEYVIDPRDYPQLDHVLSDPYGTWKNLGRVVGTLPSNAWRYLMHDVLGQIDNKVGDYVRSGAGAFRPDYDPILKAALDAMHDSTCPKLGACTKQVKRFLQLRALMNDPRLGRPSAEELADLQRLLFGDFRRGQV